MPALAVGLAIAILVGLVLAAHHPPGSADHAGMRVRVGERISPANPAAGRDRRLPWWVRPPAAPTAVLPARCPHCGSALHLAAAPPPEGEPGRDWPRAA